MDFSTEIEEKTKIKGMSEEEEAPNPALFWLRGGMSLLLLLQLRL